MMACLSVPPVKSVTSEEVVACQTAWADAIVNISKIYKEKGDFVAAAGEAAGKLYGYGHGTVLFKPTKAAEYPFRPNASEAMSYFVGSKNVEKGYAEDAGFAISGGKGWEKVVFENHQIDCHGEVALAMGTYYFTCATSKDVVKVEYTFGYKRNADGKVRVPAPLLRALRRLRSAGSSRRREPCLSAHQPGRGQQAHERHRVCGSRHRRGLSPRLDVVLLIYEGNKKRGSTSENTRPGKKIF